MTLDGVFDIAAHIEGVIKREVGVLKDTVVAQHEETRVEVRRVGDKVDTANVVLQSIYSHPHESTILVSKVVAAISGFSLLVSSLAHVHILNPPFAVLALVSAVGFWVVAKVSQHDLRRRRR